MLIQNYNFIPLRTLYVQKYFLTLCVFGLNSHVGVINRALGQFAVGQFAVGTVRRKKRKKKSNLT